MINTCMFVKVRGRTRRTRILYTLYLWFPPRTTDIVISFFTGHVNWDANDSKIFITHSKQEGLRAPWSYMSRGMNHCWLETAGKSRIRNESATLQRAGVLPFEKCTAVARRNTT